MRINVSVLAQMPSRELDTSPLVLKRVSPPKTWWVESAHTPVPYQKAAYNSGESASSQRASRDSRRSNKPQAASSNMLNAPVRDAVSTTTKMKSSASSVEPQRRSTRASPNHTAATTAQSSKLLK